MPELPEVATACALLNDVLAGRAISSVEVAEDGIVFDGVAPAAVAKMMEGAIVASVGRIGKFFWLHTANRGDLCMHLGMNGAIVETTPGRAHVVQYVEATYEASDPRIVKYRKISMETEEGRRVMMVDKRRFSRIWYAEEAKRSPRIAALGPDAYEALPHVSDLASALAKRKTSIKAVLLDQGFVAGIGNWIADEVLYLAGVAPARLASGLSLAEVAALHEAIHDVCKIAVAAGARSDKFPPGWMFHHRWGGAKGTEFIEGEAIVRETVAGRTTAWVPSRQH